VVGETTTASSGAVNNSSNCDISCPNVTCEANVINVFTLLQSSLKLLFSASTFNGSSSRNAYYYFTFFFMFHQYFLSLVPPSMGAVHDACSKQYLIAQKEVFQLS
jgi:hypothetical protein